MHKMLFLCIRLLLDNKTELIKYVAITQLIKYCGLVTLMTGCNIGFDNSQQIAYSVEFRHFLW